jgi:hypothetical protein
MNLERLENQQSMLWYNEQAFWLAPGGGLPPSAQSGKWIFLLITEKDKKSFKVG